jgi:hypothetical protein
MVLVLVLVLLRPARSSSLVLVCFSRPVQPQQDRPLLERRRAGHLLHHGPPLA